MVMRSSGSRSREWVSFRGARTLCRVQDGRAQRCDGTDVTFQSLACCVYHCLRGPAKIDKMHDLGGHCHCHREHSKAEPGHSDEGSRPKQRRLRCGGKNKRGRHRPNSIVKQQQQINEKIQQAGRPMWTRKMKKYWPLSKNEEQ